MNFGVVRIAALLLSATALSVAAEAPRRGLQVSFTAQGKSDTREARLVALYVPAGQPPSPFLPAGPFAAAWEGAIVSPMRGDFTFAAEVSGEVAVTINGAKILSGSAHAESQTVSLKKGSNELRVEYRSPAAGDAMLRLLWASKAFPFEPVPPTSFTHATAPDDLLRTGRLLFAERRCAACHDAAGALPAPGEGMPELAQDAPVFAEFGARFNETFLAHWINDPHSIRPHALMPRVFPGPPEKVDPQAADLAAFLVSLGERREGMPDDANVPLGGALFANLGCIACHTAPDYSDKDEFNRVPLSHVKAKWQEPALREYLRDPQKFYRWTRMPNFRLSEEEATRLAAYLLSGTQREFAKVPKGDAAKGSQLAVSLGCLNCHAGLPPSTAPKLADTLKTGWKSGCVADDEAARGKAPDFHFEPSERAALRAFAGAGLESLKTDSPAEFRYRQVANLRCGACHPADGESNVWSQLDNETAPLQAGAPPAEGEGQPLAGTGAPLFTWFGEKLRPEWAAKFIAGEIPYKPRPWLLARMPGFGVRAPGLALGMAADHGFPLATAAAKAGDPGAIKAGETLVSENGGFNCTTCHALGERPPTAPFEAPAINLAYAHERLRKEYYDRWVYFPQRIDPDTKMPRFSDDNGKTPLTDFYEGTARRQYDAIWDFVGTVPAPPLK